LIILKLLVHLLIATALIIWSSLLLSKGDGDDGDDDDEGNGNNYNGNGNDIVYIGTIACSVLSIVYTVKTVFWGVHHILLEFPRSFLVGWSIYSTFVVYKSENDDETLKIIVVLLWILSLSNIFVMRFPRGEDGEFRV